jgi:hypothetical protein
MTLRCGYALAFALLGSGLALAAEPEIVVVKDAEGRPLAFEAAGLPEARLAELRRAEELGPNSGLAVYVLSSKGEAQRPAIAGSYTVDDTRLRFTPRYALRPGLNYLVELSLAAASNGRSAPRLRRNIFLPTLPPGEPTRITAVYPSAETLPDNQLRFYIHFSRPMSRGEAYSRIRLLDDEGQPIERAFLEIGEELWDKSCQRLTLLFDPGRVKRGLRPREEFGPVLEEGRKYTLAIDRAWRDEHGRPLSTGLEKRITAGPAIEKPLDTADWKIARPFAGTRYPLRVRFPYALDHALLEWTMDVQTASGETLPGEVAVTSQERQWEFQPEQAWTAGTYTVVIDTTLEDTAGNRIGRAFEVDVFDEVDKQAASEHVRLPFEIK